MFSKDPQNHHDCDQDDPHDDQDQDIQQEFKVRREKRRKSGKFSHCFKSTERGCQNLQ